MLHLMTADIVALIVREIGLDARTVARLGLSCAVLWHMLEGTGEWLDPDSDDPFHFLWPFGGRRKLSNIGVVTFGDFPGVTTHGRPMLLDGMTVGRYETWEAKDADSHEWYSRGAHRMCSIVDGFCRTLIVNNRRDSLGTVPLYLFYAYGGVAVTHGLGRSVCAVTLCGETTRTVALALGHSPQLLMADNVQVLDIATVTFMDSWVRSDRSQMLVLYSMDGRRSNTSLTFRAFDIACLDLTTGKPLWRLSQLSDDARNILHASINTVRFLRERNVDDHMSQVCNVHFGANDTVRILLSTALEEDYDFVGVDKYGLACFQLQGASGDAPVVSCISRFAAPRMATVRRDHGTVCKFNSEGTHVLMSTQWGIFCVEIQSYSACEQKDIGEFVRKKSSKYRPGVPFPKTPCKLRNLVVKLEDVEHPFLQVYSLVNPYAASTVKPIAQLVAAQYIVDIHDAAPFYLVNDTAEFFVFHPNYTATKSQVAHYHSKYTMVVDAQLEDGTRAFQNNFHRATFMQLPFNACVRVLPSTKAHGQRELLAIASETFHTNEQQYLLSPRNGGTVVTMPPSVGCIVAMNATHALTCWRGTQGRATPVSETQANKEGQWLLHAQDPDQRGLYMTSVDALLTSV